MRGSPPESLPGSRLPSTPRHEDGEASGSSSSKVVVKVETGTTPSMSQKKRLLAKAHSDWILSEAKPESHPAGGRYPSESGQRYSSYEYLDRRDREERERYEREQRDQQERLRQEMERLERREREDRLAREREHRDQMERERLERERAECGADTVSLLVQCNVSSVWRPRCQEVISVSVISSEFVIEKKPPYFLTHTRQVTSREGRILSRW